VATFSGVYVGASSILILFLIYVFVLQFCNYISKMTNPKPIISKAVAVVVNGITQHTTSSFLVFVMFCIYFIIFIFTHMCIHCSGHLLPHPLPGSACSNLLFSDFVEEKA
jgi:type II secretory pathway component PulF